MTQRPSPLKRPPGRYLYEGFFTNHWGVIGDEFWLKLEAKKTRKAAKAAKRAKLWARIRSWL